MILVLATLICIFVSVFIGKFYVKSRNRKVNQAPAQPVIEKIHEIKPVKALVFDEFKPSSYLNLATSTDTKLISPVSLLDVVNKPFNDTLQADKKEIKQEFTSCSDTVEPSIEFADYRISYDSVYQDLGQSSKPKLPLTRAQQIKRQYQYHTPLRKSRCHHWPNCTNNNCKYVHPKRNCRNGNYCSFADKCMFIHPNDLLDVKTQFDFDELYIDYFKREPLY